MIKFVALFVFLLVTAPLFSQDASTPEGQRELERRTRFYSGTPITSFSEVIMKFKIKENAFSSASPALYQGIPYLGTQKDIVVGIDGFSFAGGWGQDDYGAVTDAPAVSENLIIAGYSSGKVVGYNRKESTVAWEYSAKGAVNTTPLVVEDKVFVTDDKGGVACILLADGTVKWKFNAIAAAASPSFKDGKLFVGNAKCQYTYALDVRDGKKIWEYESAGGTPVLGEDLVYVRQKNGTLVVLEMTTGSKLWSFRGQFYEPSEEMALAPTHLIVGSVSNIVAIDPRMGKQLWEKNLPRPLAGSPIIVGDVIYAPCIDWNMYVLDLNTGKSRVADNLDIGFSPKGSPAFVKGKLFYPSNETLYTFEEDKSDYVSDTASPGLHPSLLYAAEYGNIDDVRLAVETSGVKVDTPNSDGKTPLILAAEYGHTEVVRYLLAKGASVDAKDNYGRTALMYAAWWKQTDALRVLLGSGAQPNAQDNKGLVALAHGGMEGAYEECKLLIDAGATVDIIDKQGQTPLIHTAWEGKNDVVELFTANRANVNLQDTEGVTALMKAAEFGHSSTCSLLLKKQANAKLKNKEGKTAYDIAKEKNMTEVMKVLKGK